jgi:hypothetical protein
MTRSIGSGPFCDDCGEPCAEAWQTVCDWCYAQRALSLCVCAHDERDQCVCYDACPKYDVCPAYEALILADEYGPGINPVPPD